MDESVRFVESQNAYEFTPRYLDYFSPPSLPTGPKPIFTDFSSSLASEFLLFSEFIQKNAHRADDFIYFHNTLILRSDIILGFSTQAMLLERLVNRFIKDNKLEIPLKKGKRSINLV